MSEYIINPKWFYFVDVLSDLECAICVIVGVLAVGISPSTLIIQQDISTTAILPFIIAIVVGMGAFIIAMDSMPNVDLYGMAVCVAISLQEENLTEKDADRLYTAEMEEVMEMDIILISQEGETTEVTEAILSATAAQETRETIIPKKGVKQTQAQEVTTKA